MFTCETCQKPFEKKTAMGRKPKHCSKKCRYKNRCMKIGALLKELHGPVDSVAEEAAFARFVDAYSSGVLIDDLEDRFGSARTSRWLPRIPDRQLIRQQNCLRLETRTRRLGLAIKGVIEAGI